MSDKPKHTPGPWAIKAEETKQIEADEIEVGVFDSNIVIAGVWPHGEDHVGIVEQNANAHLIAAAPLLLSVLKEAIALSDRVEAEGRKRNAEADALYRRAVSAVDIAEGGAA